LIGDLNSLSPLDSYDENELLEKMKKAGIQKFGIDYIRKDVQKRILDAKLIDALRQLSDKFEFSAPTEYNKDETHFMKLRVDYIFITEPLLPLLDSAKILRTEETEQLSDHFPIVAEFNSKLFK
jgi:exonuclease III